MDDADTTLPPYLRALARPQPATPAAADDDEYTAFAGGRVGVKAQQSVTFRTAGGAGLTLAYAHLYGIADDGPEAGFTLEFTRHTVAVRGRNLGRLHKLLGDHRAREVRACEPLHGKLVPDGEPVVTGLEIRPRGCDLPDEY